MGNTKSKLVVAIEVGNVNSGYAFGTGKNRVDKIYTASQFNDLQRDRIPTALLLNDDLSFESFGYYAQQKYMSLSLKNEHSSYKFINSLKVHRGKDNKLYINDFKGADILAEDIYAKIIDHLHELCFKQIKNIESLDQLDKCLVVIVPCDVKKEMRVAIKEKIKYVDKYQFVCFDTNAKAGSAYCARQAHILNQSSKAKPMSQNTKYAVVNFGKDATIVSFLEIMTNEHFKRLEKITVPSGGDSITNLLLEYINDHFEMQGNWDEFSREHVFDYIDLRRAIDNEVYKFNDTTESVIIEMPRSVKPMMKRNTNDSGIFSDTEDNKICISKEGMKRYFESSLKQIISTIIEDKDWEERSNAIVFLLGGFSTSPVVRDIIEESVKPTCAVLVPEPGLAVLKGAIKIGFNDNVFLEKQYGFITLSKPNKGSPSFTKIMYENKGAFFIKVFEKNQNLKNKESKQCELRFEDSEKRKAIVLYQTKKTLSEYNSGNGTPVLTEKDFKNAASSKEPGKDGWNENEKVQVKASIKGNDVDFSLDILIQQNLEWIETG